MSVPLFYPVVKSVKHAPIFPFEHVIGNIRNDNVGRQIMFAFYGLLEQPLQFDLVYDTKQFVPTMMKCTRVLKQYREMIFLPTILWLDRWLQFFNQCLFEEVSIDSRYPSLWCVKATLHVLHRLRSRFPTRQDRVLFFPKANITEKQCIETFANHVLQDEQFVFPKNFLYALVQNDLAKKKKIINPSDTVWDYGRLLFENEEMANIWQQLIILLQQHYGFSKDYFDEQASNGTFFTGAINQYVFLIHSGFDIGPRLRQALQIPENQFDHILASLHHREETRKLKHFVWAPTFNPFHYPSLVLSSYPRNQLISLIQKGHRRLVCYYAKIDFEVYAVEFKMMHKLLYLDYIRQQFKHPKPITCQWISVKNENKFYAVRPTFEGSCLTSGDFEKLDTAHWSLIMLEWLIHHLVGISLPADSFIMSFQGVIWINPLVSIGNEKDTEALLQILLSFLSKQRSDIISNSSVIVPLLKELASNDSDVRSRLQSFESDPFTYFLHALNKEI